MLLLSPPKLLAVLLVALVVLGPDKLPELSRRAGALWRDVQHWRARLEREVRASFPDLPPTAEIARAVRSPVTFLDRLADEHVGVRPSSPVAAAPAPGAPPSGPSSPGPERDAVRAEAAPTAPAVDQRLPTGDPLRADASMN